MKPKYNTAKFRNQTAGASLVTAIVVCFSGAAHATTWVGDTSADWNENLNWSGDAGTGGSNAVISTVPANIATISADIAATPVDILVADGGGLTGRLIHNAGSANTGNGNWMVVGRGGGNGTYDLADTATSGGAFTGYGTGSGSMTPGNVGTNGRLYIGSGGGSIGKVNVNTSGTLAVRNDMIIGEGGGNATFNLDAGTVTTGGWNFCGSGAGTQGFFNVSGGSLTNSGRFYFGENGTGTAVQTGGTVSNGSEVWIGQGGTGVASYTISGGTMSVGNWFAVGREGGQGTLAMSGNATVTKTGGGDFILGSDGTGGNGTLTQKDTSTLNINSTMRLGTATGSAATWTMDGGTANLATLLVSDNGTGTFTLNGGSVITSGDLTVAAGSGTGVFNLNGGTVTTHKLSGGNGTATANFNGTQIVVSTPVNPFIENLDTATINTNGLKLDTAGFDVSVTQSFDGTGGVVKSGAGKLTLSGTNSYSGSNTVNGGQLVIKAGTSGGGAVSLANGTSLGVVAQSYGAQLASSSVSFGTTNALNLDLGDVAGFNPTNSILNVTGSLVLGGNVTVNVAGSKFQAASMPLVSYVPGNKTGAGNFVLGALPNGVVANLVDDTVNGLVYLNITSVALPEWDGTNEVLLAKFGNTTDLSADVVMNDVTGIVVGQAVRGDGIPTGTTVSVITGLTVTLSQAATATATGAAVNFVATPGTNEGVWNTTTQNWVDQVTTLSSLYADPNPALFSDLATGPTAVVLNTTVSPSAVQFNNSVKTYSLSGAGKISNTATLTKSGTGSLTVNNTNDYTGVTTLAGGITTVATLTNGGAASPLGAATAAAANLVLSGGTLNYTGATVSIDRGFTTGGLDGAITVPGGSDLTLSGPVAGGSGSSFNKQGIGSLILTNSSVTLGAVGQVNEVLAGTLKFSGPGQTVSIPGELWVGSVPAAAGHLVVENTALTVGGWLPLGRGNGNTGLLSTITATNSTVVCGNLSTGYDNGLPNDSDQTVTLTNTTWATNGQTLLGESTNATTVLTIDGTSVYNANGRFLTALGTGSVCNITVQGTLNHAGDWLSVGNSGTGVATMTVTGIVNSSGDFNIGDVDTSNGTLNIQVNGKVTSTGNVYIGKNTTTGVVNLSGASTMSSPQTNVGGNDGDNKTGNGTLNIAGTSVYTSNNWLRVGSGVGSTGNVLIEGSGSMVVNDFVSVGYKGGGSMTVKNSGSFSTNNDFSVNEDGIAAATLTLQDTGTITVGATTFVGRNAARVGTVTQTGGTYTGNGGEFQIGASGTGTWLQSGGITNAGGWVAIGRQSGSTGVLTVSGTGTFNQTGAGNALIVGEVGTGTMNIQGTATVSSVGSNGVIVSNNAVGVGTVNLDGGTLVAKKITDGGGASTFNFNGGVLKAASGADLNFMSGLNTVDVKPGGAYIDSNGQTIAIAQGLGDLGGDVHKQGAGTLQLNGANPYLGTTFVDLGTLGGTGSVSGPLVVAAVASVNPGASAGTFTADSADISGAYVCEIDGATADKLAVGGGLTLISGAVLDFNELAAPTAPVYVIASYATLTGTFTVQDLPAGYTVNYAYNNGLNSNNIALVQTTTPYSTWASSFGLNPLTDGAPGVDKDNDGQSNGVEFALGGSPISGSDNARIYSLVADSDDGGSVNELLMTIAVRSGTPAFAGTPSPTAAKDGATYTVQGSTTLVSFTTGVTPVAPVITGLPAVPAGYEYRTFSLDGSNGTPSAGFLRVQVSF